MFLRVIIIFKRYVVIEMVLCCSVSNCIVLYCIVLYCIVLYCIVLYCIVLYCIVMYCIVLYIFIALHCIVLYSILLQIERVNRVTHRQMERNVLVGITFIFITLFNQIHLAIFLEY